MKYIAFAAAGTALIILGTAPTPAYADCASDVAKAEVAMKDITPHKRNRGILDEIKELVEKSKKLIGNKKKRKKCAKLMAGANKRIKYQLDNPG